MKMFCCVSFLLAAFSLFGAEALQCMNIMEYDCTAYDYSYYTKCKQVEADNTRSIETCLYSEDSCYYTSFYITEPGSYKMRVTAGGCENGVINGCYTRSQMAAVDPGSEKALEDLEDAYGLTVQDLNTCFCTTNLCNTDFPDQSVVTPKQGVVTPKQGVVTHGQEALQCHSIVEYDCTAYDYNLYSTCREVEADNTRGIETCLYSQDSCYYSTFYFTEPGEYKLKITVAGCENGEISGCYSRSELASLDPVSEKMLEDTEDEYGLTVQGLRACFCTTPLCNTGLSDQSGVIPYQGGDGPGQDIVTQSHGGGSLLVQNKYGIFGLLVIIAMFPLVDFNIM